MTAMNHPGEAIPLQGRYDGFPGQPSAPTSVHYTTVNIANKPPPDHIIWSLCCFVYLNPFFLGLAALIFSIKARDRKMAGDMEGARHYGSTARCLNIVSTVLISITIISFIITIVCIANAFSHYSYYDRYHYRG